ncbi:TonB family protein [Adhaeribacter sp. BT258]|uniref:TonB family protein n=1 Tax=Adhaeribacter terrigena TaxID=2793070 RepID=A0ABS1C0Q6_9BACT|nr:energy transducer TonB [Adhaeribacter terrigena]MBK0402915.1 TonB family protein [Adhaeribacter terrigena]
MEKIIIPILLGFPLLTFGQELKEVKKTFPQYQEEYTVLKKDKNVKEGAYLKSNNNLPIQTGFYKNNLKDSTWVTYFDGNKKIESSGKFKGGKRIGHWKFFNSKGELTKEYDYTADKLIYFKPEEGSNAIYSVQTENGFENKKLDQQPLFFPNKDGNDIEGYVKYPQEAMRQGISGTVVLSYLITESGKLTDILVLKPLGGGCSEEAVRAIYPMKQLIWIPGNINGEPVTVKYTLPIKFGVQ